MDKKRFDALLDGVKRFGLNLAASSSIPVVSAILQTVIDKIDDAELTEQIKKLTDSALRDIPPVPFSVEVKNAEVIIINYCEPVYDEGDRQAIRDSVVEICNVSHDVSDDLFVETNFIILNLGEMVDKSYIDSSYIEPITEFLSKNDIEVKSVIYI